MEAGWVKIRLGRALIWGPPKIQAGFSKFEIFFRTLQGRVFL